MWGIAGCGSTRDYTIDRLRTALEVWMTIAAPFHEFAAQLFKNAADPASPLSPFSAESAPARDAMIELYRGVLVGSDAKLDADVRIRLDKEVSSAIQQNPNLF